jgi:hypothetical protein
MALKGQYFEIIKWGTMNFSRENKVQIFFGVIFEKKSLCVIEEYI